MGGGVGWSVRLAGWCLGCRLKHHCVHSVLLVTARLQHGSGLMEDSSLSVHVPFFCKLDEYDYMDLMMKE